jgi:putative acetyltransferase
MIRETRESDQPDLEVLYSAAFPDEELRPLVRELLNEPEMTLSLASFADGKLVAHIVLTHCRIEGSQAEVALLGPLAVLPQQQRRGIGTALVQAALQRLRNAGVVTVYVLGDPEYYGRFGFRPERSVTPPYELPKAWADAWQSLAMGGDKSSNNASATSTSLIVPAPWQRRELWTP